MNGVAVTEGAAAPADVVLALRALAEGVLPPTPNVQRPAPGLDLDLVTVERTALHGWEHALVVSRGLGGMNAGLVVRRGTSDRGTSDRERSMNRQVR